MRGVSPTDVLASILDSVPVPATAQPAEPTPVLTRRGWSLVGAVDRAVRRRAAPRARAARGARDRRRSSLLVGADVWVRAHPPQLRARRELKERLQVGVDGRVDRRCRVDG